MATSAQSDGFTFCVQRAGPNAVGGAAGSLGYEGLPRSAAVKFDLYNNKGEGPNSTGVYTAGQGPHNEGAIDLTPSRVYPPA